jgi:hypothetical protein
MEGEIEGCDWIAFRRIEYLRVCAKISGKNTLVEHLFHLLSVSDFARLSLFLVERLQWPRPSVMNLPVSVLPDLAENMADSPNPKFRKNPINEDHGRQVGNDEIVLNDYAQVQRMRHICSFLRLDNP